MRDVENATAILENIKLLSSETRIEFTERNRFPKDVHYYTTTRLGASAKWLTITPLRQLLFWAYLQKRRLRAILGLFAFIKLLSNAGAGIALLDDWFALLAALMVDYIIFRSAIET